MLLLLIRHAETEWNEQHRRQGWADPPLTRAGRSAAAEWSSHPPRRLDGVVASDLARAEETANIIAFCLGLGAVQLLRGLREQHQGAWTGLTKAEIKARWPDPYRRRPRHPVGGESAVEVLHRARKSLAHLDRERPGHRLLVVTHAGVIEAIERSVGCVPVPIPYLQGRWIELADSRDSAVPIVNLRDATSGRPISGAGLAAPLTGRSG
jgi:probable phosphoglycerate mutase